MHNIASCLSADGSTIKFLSILSYVSYVLYQLIEDFKAKLDIICWEANIIHDTCPTWFTVAYDDLE